jgi:transposase
MCCDMSPSFISGIEAQFPEADITFDKFHVMKLVNKALDEVRRQEQAELPMLKKTRYLWLKNQGNLTENQQEKVVKLRDMELKTGRAYRLKLLLQKLWTTHRYFRQPLRWIVHGVTTKRKMASVALEKLIYLIEEKKDHSDKPVQIKLDPKLIVRKTTFPVKITVPDSIDGSYSKR